MPDCSGNNRVLREVGEASVSAECTAAGLLVRLVEPITADMHRLQTRKANNARKEVRDLIGLYGNSRGFFWSDSGPQLLPAPFQSIDGHYLRYVTFGKRSSGARTTLQMTSRSQPRFAKSVASITVQPSRLCEGDRRYGRLRG